MCILLVLVCVALFCIIAYKQCRKIKIEKRESKKLKSICRRMHQSGFFKLVIAEIHRLTNERAASFAKSYAQLVIKNFPLVFLPTGIF